MRTLFAILVSLILGGCVAKPDVAHYENIPIGSSKEYTCDQWLLIAINNKQRNVLCRYDHQDKYRYFENDKAEIITNDNKVFYVFENVNSKMYCTFALGCFFGDGKLKLITRDFREASAAVEVILNMLEDKIFPQQILVEFDELNKATEISLDRFFDCHYKILSNNYKLVKTSSEFPNFLYIKNLI